MKKTLKFFWLVCLVLLACAMVLTGCDEKEKPNDTNDDIIDDGGEHVHAFGDWTVTKEATCTENGEKERVCACGEKEVLGIESLGHIKVVDPATTPTCTTEGKTEGEHCSGCGLVFVEQTSIPVVDHTYDNDEDEKCNVCDFIRDVDCKHTKTEVLKAVSATCTASGLTEGKKCANCGKTLVSQKKIDKLPHTEVIDEAVAATCTKTGLTEGKRCAVCDTVIKKQSTVAATGHIFDNENDEKCNVCGAKNPDYVAPLPSIETIDIGALTHTTITIDKITHTSIKIDDAALNGYNREITKEDQIDKFSFTAPRDGTYRIELSNMKASMTVELYIYDKLGECVDSNRAVDNNEGLTVVLSANETYEIRVREYDLSSGTYTGTYTLTIWHQKPTSDVTNYTIIKDSIEYADQRNKYTFTPSISGTYRFDFSNMKSSTTVEIYIYNELDECIGSNRAVDNNEGLTLALSANETYEIRVREYDLSSGTYTGTYTLTIWHQKPTTDVSSVVQIKDSIQYTDQKNVYNFTADVAGNHNIKITGLSSSFYTEIYVYDNLDYKVAYDTYFQNNDTIILKDLEIGTNYTIVVYQSKGTGGYTLTIE